ncbi:MAG: DUF2264 domain-containing protein [Actinocrinis sp.]
MAGPPARPDVDAGLRRARPARTPVEWTPVGWTRGHWERLADRTLAAVRPYATPGHGLIHLPGPQSRSGRWSDGLEGFARTFLLAGFRLAQSADRDPGAIAEWYAAGLAAGTDPDSPDRWPPMAEVGQAKVECASIALALHESRPYIWDRLDQRVRENVVAWMSAMLGTDTPDNNWTWFRAVTNAFLRSVGGPWRPEDIEHAIARTEAWYVGDGWYSDGEAAPGEPRNFDYYSGWAMQFYPLWYCRVSGDAAEPGLLDRYRGRLFRYLQDAQHLIGAGGVDGGGRDGVGRPLIQGRSLTYRFAMLAPFWTGAVFDATPLSPGRTRRLTSAVAGHFVAEGCYDGDGLLPIGWHGRFEPMRETYSGSGSPYWASKGFAGLVLPPEHPVWSAPEEPLPIERHDVAFALPRLGWIVSGTKEDGIVRVAQHGGDHVAGGRLGVDVPGYGRHGFATHAAPEYGSASPLDSHIALVVDGRASHRSPALPLAVGVGRGVSRHRAHWRRGDGPYPNDPHQEHLHYEFAVGPWLTTASLLHGPWEVRMARVDPAGPGDLGGQWPARPGPWTLRFGGWALGLDESIRPHVVGGAAAWATRDDGLSTTVVSLRGAFWAGCTVSQGTNPLGAFSAIPQVETVEPVEFGTVYAALVVLSGTLSGPRAAEGVTFEVHQDERGGSGHDPSDTRAEGGAGVRVEVGWPDGHRDELLLPGAPNELSS